jgi:hypothetical protein
MMRAYRTSLLLVLATTAVAHAQTSSDKPATTPADAAPATAAPPPISDWDAQVSDFDKLRTPDSPAFVVLGVSPTEIQRPTTPGTLVATLGGAMSDSSLTVPKDFALEIAPYWLFSHPDVPLQDYRSNHLMRPIRTLSLSVGTTQAARSESDTTGMMISHTDSHIGVGLRTTLFQSGADDPCTAASNGAIELAAAATVSAADKAELETHGKPGDSAYDAALKTLIESKVSAYNAKQKSNLERAVGVHNDTCVALTTSPTGFQVDLAGAIDLRVADSKLTWSGTTTAGYAVWANASYDWLRFSAVAMARLASHDLDVTTGTTTERAFDSGARGIYKAKTYVVSAEALMRYRLTDVPDRTTIKVDAGLEYELTASTWISLTFGKDFAFKPGDAGSFFSLANLKWGFLQPQTN